MVVEGVLSLRSRRFSSRRLAEDLGIHCLVSLGSLRVRNLRVAFLPRVEGWGFLCLGRSPRERENTCELITTGDLIRLMVEGDFRGVTQGMVEEHRSPKS